MRLLFEMDKRDYAACTHSFTRNSARSIIIRDKKIAMIHGSKHNYYEVPGGGIETGETAEEAGLVVIPSSVREYGYVHRIQKSDGDETECFIQDNFYYLCETEASAAPQNLDGYEAEEAYTLEWVDPYTAIRRNRSVVESPYNPLMFEREARVREARVLELLISEGYFN